MLTPKDVIPKALLDRLAALESRMAGFAPAMAAEADRLTAIRAQLMQGIRVSPEDYSFLLANAGSDTMRQYWTIAQASAT